MDFSQKDVNSGIVWHLEGSVGRAAMRALERGDLMLGRVAHRDYWGNVIPSRDMVEPGTKGSYQYVADRRGVEYADHLAEIA